MHIIPFVYLPTKSSPIFKRKLKRALLVTMFSVFLPQFVKFSYLDASHKILPVMKNLPNMKNLPFNKNLSFIENLPFHKILQFSKKSTIHVKLLSISIFLNIVIVKIFHHFLISMSRLRL